MSGNMGARSGITAAFLAAALGASAADVVIQSFNTGGTLTFNELANATVYRVEWSSSPPGGAWTNFAAASARLDSIPATGSGIVTASVPLWFRVVAAVTNAPPPPSVMVLIPGGSFVMGATTNVGHEADANEVPQHAVDIGAFYLDRYEVTKALWDEVTAYNGGNGYSYFSAISAKATNHPVFSLNWYDAVKWCNARSEKDGLVPVYYTDAGFTALYKSGQAEPYANWSADGYRLPTEAEWEKAARGGVADTRFPWTDYTNRISHAKANYYGDSSSYSYDLSYGSHPAYNDGSPPYTSPVGSFAPNGYGLYDMAGNVWEWCWDWYAGDYYSTSPGTDPRGATSGLYRVERGGTWNYDSFNARCAHRMSGYPDGQRADLGFRCARGP